MKLRFLPLICFFIVASGLQLHAAEVSWVGEYADKKFLSGSATFQLSIEQEGSKIQVSFDAANNNGKGCAPEAQAIAKVSGKDKLVFTFCDNQGNAGDGTITRSGEELLVSLKPTRVAKQDCAVFYRDNIRVKRVTK